MTRNNDETEISSPAAAFSRQGDQPEPDTPAGEVETDASAMVEVDAPEQFHEAALAIEAAAQDGDFCQARLEAATVVGSLDKSTVEAARDQIEEQYWEGIQHEATAGRVVKDARKLELNAGSGNMVNVAKCAIKIVESINNRSEN